MVIHIVALYISACNCVVQGMAGSLANATSTRVDSASKHIIPCRVSTDYMVSLVGNSVDNATRELQINKMKYCMHKDDMVIGLGRAMYGSSVNSSRKRAYPSVIVTLASMDEWVRNFIALQNFLTQGPSCPLSYKRSFVRAVLEEDEEMDGGTDDKYSISRSLFKGDRVR